MEKADMIRLLVIDDEQIIRMGIKNSIPWEEHGIQVVGDAADGEEGYRLAMKCRPDIILTDLRMPKMDGIELIKKLKESGLPAKVIVLTAYNETSYYAQVIPLGIQNFVIKNACSDAILTEVLKVAETIKEEREVRSRTEDRERLLTENMYIIQSSYMAGVLSGKELPGSWEEKQRELELSLPGPNYAVIAMSVQKDDWWTLVSLAGQILKQFSPFVFPYGEDIFSVILNFCEEASCRRQIEEFIGNVRGCCVQDRLVVLMPFPSFSSLFGKGAGIEAALDRCCWMEQDGERFLLPVFRPAGFSLTEVLKFEKSLMPDISADTEQHGLQAWYDYMKAVQTPYVALQESACRICMILGSMFHRMDQASEILRRIRAASHAEEMLSDLRALLEPQAGHAIEKGQVGAALDFMEKNYAKNLTIADVAKSIYMSPNYLSKIFKRETGFTFKETLNKIRIEKAKELLKDPSLRHYEIAEQVGYSDYKKFSKYFHEYSGCSAKEYRLNALTLDRNTDRKDGGDFRGDT